MKSVSSSPENAEIAATINAIRSHNEQIWIAGCTRPGEEELILEAFDALRTDFPKLQLWLAPRHANRFEHVNDLLREQGRSILRLSEFDATNAPGHSPSIVLIDRLGVLAQMYQYADVAFIGGSLLRYGGHNPLEPALVGTPVTFGPYMADQRDAVELLANSGLASEVWGTESLALAIANFLRADTSPEQRRAYGERLRARIAETQHRVAADLLSRLPSVAPTTHPAASSA
jgi:3-deoxy-D-manno-octulosonic-acid transferase